MKEFKKEHKVESKEDAAEDTADEETEADAPVHLVTHINNNLDSSYPMLSRTSTMSNFLSEIGCRRTSFVFGTTSSEPSLNIREFCRANSLTFKNLLMRLWMLPSPNSSPRREL